MTGTQLAAARKSLTQTQDGLACILGVARNTVARWESGLLAMPKWMPLVMKGLGAEWTEAQPKKTTRKPKKK